MFTQGHIEEGGWKGVHSSFSGCQFTYSLKNAVVNQQKIDLNFSVNCSS